MFRGNMVTVAFLVLDSDVLLLVATLRSTLVGASPGHEGERPSQGGSKDPRRT